MRAKRAVVSGLLMLLVSAAAFFAVTAVTGAPGDTYTGCLKKGKLLKVSIGSEPVEPCKPDRETEVSWTADAPPGSTGLENEGCPAGRAISGFDPNGEVVCDEP